MTKKQQAAKERNEAKIQAATDTLFNAFKSGKMPAALAQLFLKTAGTHAGTLSWSNQVLIALAGFDDAMAFGAKDGSSGWLSKGRRVIKGEKSRCFILRPNTFKVDDPKNPGEKLTICKGFSTVSVFGTEQTEIIDAELWAKHNKGNEKAQKFLDTLPLREVADAWGLTVKAYSGQKGKAHGWYAHGQAIGMGVENLSTWAHELIHAADDKAGNLVERGQHWRSEVVAEMGGAILMLAMGYETDADLGGCWDYVSHYARDAKIDPLKACNDVIKRTCEAVKLILDTASELAAPMETDEATATEPIFDLPESAKAVTPA